MNKKEIIDYFRSNIFESLTAYNAWKIIVGSRSNGIVSQDMANMYVKVQKFCGSFFPVTEHAFLFQFVIQALHSFDNRSDSVSLYKVDRLTTKTFVSENLIVIEALKNVRNKIFAHRDIKLNKEAIKEYKIPSMIELDKFFKNLIIFYNQLTHNIDESVTIFDNTNNIKGDLEYLFMNIQRGETVRLEEINIEYNWLENNKKVSDIV